MRTLLPLLVFCLALTGCQRGPNAGDTVDSLEAVNRELDRQVRVLRDTLRSLQGAPPTSETTLQPPVYFPSGSAWLFDRAKERLDQHAQTLKEQYPDADFRIKGYTDSVPIGPSLKDTYPSNWYLSAQRAAAVAHYLDTEHGIRTQTLEIEAFGPKRPVAPNETPEGRRKNRRVEIVVQDGS
jgi:chemotaxis protein MotB